MGTNGRLTTAEDDAIQKESRSTRSKRAACGSGDGHQGRRTFLRGSVQGIGFRPWACRTARALGLSGSVRNVGGGVIV
ncbi:unnamed protein product, partial [marine sediment metagenome]